MPWSIGPVLRPPGSGASVALTDATDHAGDHGPRRVRAWRLGEKGLEVHLLLELLLELRRAVAVSQRMTSSTSARVRPFRSAFAT